MLSPDRVSARESRRTVTAVAGVDAEDAAFLAQGGDGRVHARVARRRVHEPRVREVGGLDRAGAPLDRVVGDEACGRDAQRGGHDAHHGAVLQEAADAARGDIATADHDDLPPGEADADHRRHDAAFHLMNTSPCGIHRDGPHLQRPIVFALGLEARAGAQIEHLLVHRRRDGRSVALGADDAAGHHVRAAVRVALLHGVDAVLVRAEQRDLLAVDQRRAVRARAPGRRARTPGPTRRAADEGVLGRVQGSRRSFGEVLQSRHRRTASVVPAIRTRGFSRSSAVAGRG